MTNRNEIHQEYVKIISESKFLKSKSIIFLVIKKVFSNYEKDQSLLGIFYKISHHMNLPEI